MSASRAFVVLSLILCTSQFLYGDGIRDISVDVDNLRTITLRKVSLPSTGEPKDKNIGHVFLDVEAKLNTVSAEMYDLVDEVIRRVKARLLASAPQDFESREDYALNALATIDEVMTELNFVFPPSSRSIVTFGQSLTPTKLTKDELTAVFGMSVNARRRDHIRENYDKDFFLADCDTGSVMYLAVGEALDLPVFLVEVPQHIFVRWYFDDKEYLNWETTGGLSHSDKHYIRNDNIPLAAIDKGIYLSKMDRSTTIGFANCLVGMVQRRNKAFAEARASFKIGMQTYVGSPLALHSFARLLENDPDASEQDWKEVMELTTHTLNLFEDATLFHVQAMAFSASGEFAKAIQSEKRAQELYEKSEPSSFRRLTEAE